MGYSFVSHGGAARMSNLIVDGDLDMAGFDVLGAASVSGAAVAASGDVTAGGDVVASGLSIPLITHNPASPVVIKEFTNTDEAWEPTAGDWYDVYDITVPDLPTATPHSPMGVCHVGFGAEADCNHATLPSSYRVINSAGTPVAEWISFVSGLGYVELPASPPVLVTPGETFTFQRRRDSGYARIRNPKIYGVGGAVGVIFDDGSITASP